MSVRKSSHGTIFLIVSSGSPRALIASSLRSTSKKPFCPMTRSLHPPMTACGHRVRFVATWREEFFEVPLRDGHAILLACVPPQQSNLSRHRTWRFPLDTGHCWRVFSGLRLWYTTISKPSRSTAPCLHWLSFLLL